MSTSNWHIDRILRPRKWVEEEGDVMAEEDFKEEENPQKWKVVGEHKYPEPDGGVRAVVRITGPAKIELSTAHYHYAVEEDLSIAAWIASSLNAAIVSADEITKDLGL